jgi:hypothetical protein
MQVASFWQDGNNYRWQSFVNQFVMTPLSKDFDAQTLLP